MSNQALQLGFNIGQSIGDAQYGAEDRKLAREQVRANIDSQVLNNQVKEQQIQQNAITLQQLQQQVDDIQAQRLIYDFNSAGAMIAQTGDATQLENLLNDPQKRQMLAKYNGLDPFEGIDILPIDGYDQEKTASFIQDVATMRAMNQYAAVGQNLPPDYQPTPEELETASKSVRLAYDTANKRTQLIDLNTISQFLFPNGYYQGQYQLAQQQKRIDAIKAALEARKTVSDIENTDQKTISDRDKNIRENNEHPYNIDKIKADTNKTIVDTANTQQEIQHKEEQFRQNQQVALQLIENNGQGDPYNQYSVKDANGFTIPYVEQLKNSDGSTAITPIDSERANALSLGFGMNDDGTLTEITNPQQFQYYYDRAAQGNPGDPKQFARLYSSIKNIAANAMEKGNTALYDYIKNFASQMDKASSENKKDVSETRQLTNFALYVAQSALNASPNGLRQAVGDKVAGQWAKIDEDYTQNWTQARFNAEDLKFIKAATLGDGKNIASLAKMMNSSSGWSSKTVFMEDLLNSLAQAITNAQVKADIADLGQAVDLINKSKKLKKAFNDVAIVRNLPMMLNKNPENTEVVNIGNQNLIDLENSFREQLKFKNVIVTDGKTVTMYPRQFTDQGENLNKFIYSAKEYKEIVEKNYQQNKGIMNSFFDFFSGN